jgi:hypothetical protein
LAICAWTPLAFREATAFWAAVWVSKSTKPYPAEGETQRHRGRDTEGETQRHRGRDTETQRERHRGRDTEGETQRERHRGRDTETQRERHRGSHEQQSKWIIAPCKVSRLKTPSNVAFLPRVCPAKSS